MRRVDVRDERGFTLPELLTALFVGMIVILACGGLVETVMKRSNETANRVDGVQRGRTAMDYITRELRSQVCATRSDGTVMTAPRSLYAATSSSVTFFSQLKDESYTSTNSSVPIPTLNTLSLAGGMITETVTTGASGSGGALTYASGTTTTRQLLTNTQLTSDAAGATTPLFTYWMWTTDNTVNPPVSVLTQHPRFAHRCRADRRPAPGRGADRHQVPGEPEQLDRLPQLDDLPGQRVPAYERPERRRPLPGVPVMPRLDARSERGFTMYIVLMAMIATSLLVAAAFAAVNGDLPQSGVSKDRKASYAAAESGLAFYLNHLQQDPDYWTLCNQAPDPNTSEKSPVSLQWDGTGTDPRAGAA